MVYYLIVLAGFSLFDWYESVKANAPRVKVIYIFAVLVAAGAGVWFYMNRDAPSIIASVIDLLGMKSK